jgi:hypothetical protein
MLPRMSEPTAFAEPQASARLLGPAATRWNDYVGTAAADDADAVLHHPSLYELAAIDRDRWMILSVDLEVRTRAAVTVYAIDKLAHGVRTAADVAELAGERGQLPVRAFTVPSPSVEDFLGGAFSQISIRLVTRAVQDYPLALSD